MKEAREYKPTNASWQSAEWPFRQRLEISSIGVHWIRMTRSSTNRSSDATCHINGTIQSFPKKIWSERSGLVKFLFEANFELNR